MARPEGMSFLVERLSAVAQEEEVDLTPPAEVWFEAFGDSSLDLSIRFWHSPEMATRWRLRSDVGMAVVDALTAARITIPFPQRTLWFGADEEQQDR